MPFKSILGGESAAILQAFNRSQAIISFTPNGIILEANENFCAALGYKNNEIIGKHHRIFLDPKDSSIPEYIAFWQRLSSGSYDQGKYKRISKSRDEIWIEASYNPVIRGGKVVKIVKIATDITATMRASMESNGKLTALSRAQAVIEFNPSGEILNANENFLRTLGYCLEEIVGKHHKIFCEPAYTRTAAYSAFWTRLAKGEFFNDEFMRLTKDGKEVFIQATYTPILDDVGNVIKVVKFASDVTERVRAFREVGEGLKRLAECNIGVTIDKAFIPEFDYLRQDFNQSLGKVQETLEEVLNKTAMLTEKSGELRESANGIAHRSEQQAAALEQITATVRESNSRTENARNLVREARTATAQSVDVVLSTVNAMSRINAASEEITKIISVIDQIAFQTNLLALNAGVEAARAGDAGKGFAVVAQEVRELAQHSAKAAKEISNLIANSSKEVKDGVRLVGETGDALNSIEKFVLEINTNVEAIAIAANEQSISLAEINTAVGALDRMTQENSGMVSGVSAVSEILANGAVDLEQVVQRFKLNRRYRTRELGTETDAQSQKKGGYGERNLHTSSISHTPNAKRYK